MKRFHKIVIWTVVVGFLLGGIGLFTFQRFSPPAKGSQEEVVLVVEGEKVTRAQFTQAYENLIRYYTQLYQMYGMDFESLLQGTEGAYRKLPYLAQAAEQLSNQVLITKEAQKLRVSVPNAELTAAVDAQYKSILTQFGGTEKQFEELLKSFGYTKEKYREELAKSEQVRLRTEKVQQVVVKAIEPTEKDLQEYYTANQSRYQTEPEKVQVARILVKDAKLADELIARAQAPGADFAALARQYSQDADTKDNRGQTDFFERYNSPFSYTTTESIWAMDVGQVKLFSDEDGYHIVKFLGRKAAVVPPLAEVKGAVREDYVQAEKAKRWSDWLTKRRDTATIKVQDPVLSAAMTISKDKTKALGILLTAREAGTSLDTYLSYYIGRLYEELVTEAALKRGDLERKSEKTKDEETEIQRLKKVEEEHKAKALAAYLVFADTGERDETFLQRALGLDSANVQLRYALAEYYREKGDYIKAELEYRTALETKPDFVAAYLGRGDTLMALELPGMAADAYKKALEYQTGSTAIRLKLAAAYIKDGKAKDAKPLVQEVLAKETDNANALALLGDVLLAEGDTAGAIARYDAAYKRSGTSDNLLKLAGAYLAGGKTDEAKKRYEEAISRFPYRAEGHVGLGDVYLKLGDKTKALNAYKEGLKRATGAANKETIARKIVDLDPEDLRTRMLLAGYFQEQYKYDAAIAQYEAVLAKSPGDVDALLGLGDCYVGKTQYDRASNYYNQALAKMATPSGKLTVLNRIVAAEEKRVGVGQPLGPQGLEALWQRALAYSDLARYDEAVADLQRIQAIDGTFRNAEINALLARLRVPQPQ